MPMTFFMAKGNPIVVESSFYSDHVVANFIWFSGPRQNKNAETGFECSIRLRCNRV